jgi:serine/threonine kinase PknH
MSDEVFGPYRLQELLGHGGMGEVYRAFHTEQERIVALKLLLPELSDDEMYRVRFLRESRLAARLTDPHVIPVHNWGEVDGRLYIDMRFIAGEDMGARLARTGAMAPAQAVDVVAQVAGALDAAHAVELVHRDVKPSNVLLAGARDSGAEFAYLADFGIARLTYSEDESADTTGGAPIGTFAYMAPERFQGAPISRSVDVYALACVLYECLTGRRPFESGEPLAVLSQHMYATPPRPSDRNPRIPATLDGVVAVGMAKEPGARFPSAGALAAAARDALSQPRIAVPPRPPRSGASTVTESGPVPPPESPSPPRPAPQPGQGSPPRAAQAPPTGRRRVRPLAVLAAVLVLGLAGVAVLTARAQLSPATPSPSASAAPRPSTDPTLSPADRALLRALPPGYTAATCGQDPARPSSATAALRCGAGPAGGPDTAEFARFPDVDALDRFVADDARLRQLPLDTGSCRNGDSIQTTWSKNGQIAGLLACYPDPAAGRTLRWTDRTTLAMGVINRVDGNSAALYDWWTRYDIGP